MGLDKTERAISLIAGAIAMVLALGFVPRLFKNTLIADTAKPSANNTCATGFHLVKGVCGRTLLAHPSYWLPQFLAILVIGAFIIFFAFRRSRPGVAVAGLMLGFAIGVIGLPFLMLGGWLVIRALRLQKYGDATFAGSTKRAREIAQAKKAGRPVSGANVTSGAGHAPAPPSSSKRYTPKQRPRRR